MNALSGSKVLIKISYQTSSTASAAQWLTPEQTAGKKYPYFFTQCQVRIKKNMIKDKLSNITFANFEF